MIKLSPQDVDLRFSKLGITSRFSDVEKRELTTMPVVDADDRLCVFPTPRENIPLTILALRRILGVRADQSPFFFDHPWYLDEAFAKRTCAPGWHVLCKEVLPESISRPENYLHSVKYSGLALPSAIEVVLMVFLYYVDTTSIVRSAGPLRPLRLT